MFIEAIEDFEGPFPDMRAAVARFALAQLGNRKKASYKLGVEKQAFWVKEEIRNAIVPTHFFYVTSALQSFDELTNEIVRFAGLSDEDVLRVQICCEELQE